MIRNTRPDPYPRRQKHALTREQAYLAQRTRAAVLDDQLLIRRANQVDDLHPAFQHNYQVVRLVAVGEQHITGAHLDLIAVPAQSCDLRHAEKGALVGGVGKQGALRWRGSAIESPLVVCPLRATDG